MSAIYLLIVVFLLCLAFFDLFVGVSNDAVNFMQSAVGARVATFRTILSFPLTNLTQSACSPSLTCCTNFSRAFASGR